MAGFVISGVTPFFYRGNSWKFINPDEVPNRCQPGRNVDNPLELYSVISLTDLYIRS
jgi:hypothetical protein